jgi:UDP-GlcNAc:undecaprenyl-phosphate GlcNAc-1-phosphate transferase
LNTYLALFVIATLVASVTTPLVRRACQRWGWLDRPDTRRRVHRVAVPRLGGIAVFASVLIALAALLPVNNLVTQALRENRWQLFQTLAPTSLVFLVGIYDDLRGANARLKFAALGIGGALFYALGGRVELLSVPLIGTVELPHVASFALTIVWVVGVSNAFNLIDGVDGLAAGAALFASLVMLVVAVMLGHPLIAVIACALCGALVGFLRYNFNPASIFLGDSGALTVGFLLAALSVGGAQKASTAVAVAIPLLAFGVPVVDTAFTLVRRFISRKPLFEGDREHIHHMLLARGWSQRRVAFVLYGACALFGMAALLLVGDAGRVTGLLLFIVAASVALAVGRLRYHEVDELRASVRRNLSERRTRTANNIGVRRAVRSMSEADSLGKFFDAARELLELGEFVHARVRLGVNANGDNGGSHTHDNGDTLPLAVGALPHAESVASPHANDARLRGVMFDDGIVSWAWERGDIEASEIHASGRFWTLRLPLSNERGHWGYVNLYRGLGADQLLIDINYLCHLFQRETTLAAERILKHTPEVAHSSAATYEARV